jgi:hypothetical protein
MLQACGALPSSIRVGRKDWPLGTVWSLMFSTESPAIAIGICSIVQLASEPSTRLLPFKTRPLLVLLAVAEKTADSGCARSIRGGPSIAIVQSWVL